MLNPLARIRLIDDDPDFLKSMGYLLRSMGLAYTAYPSAKTFLENDNANDPGCVILDVRMPDISGLELQKILNEKDHPLPIIFCSAHGTINMAVSTMQNGAISFLEKPVDANDLIAALKKALEVDNNRRKKLKSVSRLTALFETLTPKEKEVAIEISKGGSNKEVGLRLGIAEKTVQIHRTSIYKKLKVHSQLEIAELLKKIGLI